MSCAARVLYVAEIVGRAGLFAFKKLLPGLRRDLSPDLVLVNGDGTTGGSGIGKAHAVYLRKLGADVVLTGEGAFYKKDALDLMPTSPWLLRPVNYPAGVPGRGVRIARLPGLRVAVVQLLGQSGFTRVHLDNPFLLFDAMYPDLRKDADAVIVEIHAATTAEKTAFGYHADGRAAAVIGAHARARTADARLLPGGTAYITDAGRTGSILSVGGMDAATRVREYRTGIPAWARDATLEPELHGVFLELDGAGKALSIRSLRIPCKEVFHD